MKLDFSMARVSAAEAHQALTDFSTLLRQAMRGRPEPQPDTRPLLIFAGRYAQAVVWAENHGLKLGEWLYIGSQHLVRARMAPRFVRVGNWFDRADVKEIEAALADRDAKELGVAEF